MSSLKDWYRYVDSRARTRPDSGGRSEREPGADEPSASPAEPGTADEQPAAEGAPVDAVVGEEGLDVWSGLFPQRRKPDEQPTTGPLKRPTSDQEQAPADLSFAQAPIGTPPAPAFQLPETQLEIPSFEEFVSPFTPAPPAAPTPAPSAPAPPAPDAAAAASAAQKEASAEADTLVSGDPRATVTAASATTITAVPLEVTAPGAEREAPIAGVPEGQPISAQAFMPGDRSAATPGGPTSPSPGGTAESAAPSSPVPDPASSAPPQEAAPPMGEAVATTDEMADEEQVPWRSPFRLPGPGRTVSSGAAPSRAAPRVPPDRAASLEAALSTVAEQAIERTETRTPADERPIPGTPDWERERVERLARTFRETLQVLEQSRADAPVEEPEARTEPLSPPTAPASEEVSLAASATTASVLASLPPAMTAAPGQPVGEIESPRPGESLTAAASLPQPITSPAGEGRGVGMPAPALVAQPVEVPSPFSPVTAPPDVRQSIEEAALMRERLPQHIDMLLRIPTNEVAQNSYKSPFRESREELVRRLLDPQLTLEEAARVLGVCPTTVRRYTNRGMLHCHRTPGNQRRFRMSDVLQFLEQFGDRIDRAAEARQMEEAA